MQTGDNFGAGDVRFNRYIVECKLILAVLYFPSAPDLIDT